MTTFQILYLRESVLDRAEEVNVRDLLEAIDLAMMKTPDLTAEIRRDGNRVGIVGPSLSDDAIRSAELPAGGISVQNCESEIAEEMKVRLRMVR
jgi:hypothetical protein